MPNELSKREYKLIGIDLDIKEQGFPNKLEAVHEGFRALDRALKESPGRVLLRPLWLPRAKGSFLFVAYDEDGERVPLARVWPEYGKATQEAITNAE